MKLGGRPPAVEGRALTAREREVLNLVVAGMTTAEIAERLGIGVRTVDTHRSAIRAKFGSRSVIETVRLALASERTRSGIDPAA